MFTASGCERIRGLWQVTLVRVNSRLLPRDCSGAALWETSINVTLLTSLALPSPRSTLRERQVRSLHLRLSHTLICKRNESQALAVAPHAFHLSSTD